MSVPTEALTVQRAAAARENRVMCFACRRVATVRVALEWEEGAFLDGWTAYACAQHAAAAELTAAEAAQRVSVQVSGVCRSVERRAGGWPRPYVLRKYRMQQAS